MDSNYEIRLDRKTLSNNGGFGFLDKGYLNKEDYYDEINLKNELFELRKEITKLLPSVEVEKLREIREIVCK